MTSSRRLPFVALTALAAGAVLAARPVEAGPIRATPTPAVATATVPTIAVLPANAVPVNTTPANATSGSVAPTGAIAGAVAVNTGYQAPAITYVATARQRFTNAYAQPGDAKPFATFDNRKNFSGKHVFVIVGQVSGWYQVQLPMRPNGRTGWLRADAVSLAMIDWAIDVQLGAHTLVLYKAGREFRRWTVAVGSAKYPTPQGTFYLRELARTGNPRGAYGPFAFGLSAYSNVLQTFGRGDGQIGVHGTNQPGLLGQSVSHGCIRMSNDAITYLAKTLPQGVPISIRT